MFNGKSREDAFKPESQDKMFLQAERENPANQQNEKPGAKPAVVKKKTLNPFLILS